MTTFGVDRFRPSDVSRGLKSVVPVIARRSSDTNASIREESAVALRCLATAGGFLPGYNGDVVLKGAAQTSDGGFVDGSSATVSCKVSVFSCML